MANQEHLDIFRQGVDSWNVWRKQHPEVEPDLSKTWLRDIKAFHANLREVNFSEADLGSADLNTTDCFKANFSSAYLGDAKLMWTDFREADFSKANLKGADLYKSNLTKARLAEARLQRAELIKAILRDTNLSGANLSDANLYMADLDSANLKGSKLNEANLNKTNLNKADLSNSELIGTILSGANLYKANLAGANLRRANLARANLKNAVLTNCLIYGISAWDVQLEGAIQLNLVITPGGQSNITVDNLNIAQFIYMLLNNQEIRDVIDTITSKVVLILGRFTPERKAVLDALRDELRKWNYTPIVFDFEKPSSRDFTETVRTLAHLCRFILADLTDPSSIPQELQAIVPDLEVPVQPLLLEAKREYSMFVDFKKYHWVLPVYLYRDRESLIASLQKEIIKPADKKAKELVIEKAKRLERP